MDVRHEVNAVFAADAVARLSGTIGVAAVTAGPGLTNTITAIKNAQMAESPILLLGGAAANLLKGLYSFFFLLIGCRFKTEYGFGKQVVVLFKILIKCPCSR